MIRSLHMKKFRDELGLFVVEGQRMVAELLRSDFRIRILAGTEAWLQAHREEPALKRIEVHEISEQDLKSISSLTTPNEVLAVVTRPAYTPDLERTVSSLSLALDDIQDPGNLGTLIRLAEWFGITDLYCSPGTVDPFNPKVVQATMGSIFRLRLHSLPLGELFSQLGRYPGFPVYGTFIGERSLYETRLTEKGIIVLGNEAAGISPDLLPYVNRKISIPSYAARRQIDSLNVSVAAAVICAEFRRQAGSVKPS